MPHISTQSNIHRYHTTHTTGMPHTHTLLTFSCPPPKPATVANHRDLWLIWGEVGQEALLPNCLPSAQCTHLWTTTAVAHVGGFQLCPSQWALVITRVHPHPLRGMCLLASFCIREKCNSEKVRNLPKVTELVSSKLGLEARPLTSEHKLFTSKFPWPYSLCIRDPGDT